MTFLVNSMFYSFAKHSLKANYVLAPLASSKQNFPSIEQNLEAMSVSGSQGHACAEFCYLDAPLRLSVHAFKFYVYTIYNYTYPFSILISLMSFVLGESTSGYTSFEMARAAGAFMTQADKRWVEGTPNEIYAPSTEPAIVAKPLVITACNSDNVRSGRNGRMRSGASVYKLRIIRL